MAAAAGVSTATVSAVVNGRAERYGICRTTQEKVKTAIRQMGYPSSGYSIRINELRCKTKMSTV